MISKTKRSSEKWSTGGSFWRISCRVASSSDWHLEHRYLQKHFNHVNPSEPVEQFTCYPQLVSRIEEALLCSFRAKHCPFIRFNKTYSRARNRTYLEIDLYFKEVRIILRTGSTPRAGCRVCLCSFELDDSLYENEKTMNRLRSIHLIRNEMF